MVCIILRKGQIKWCKICLFLIILLNNLLNYQGKDEVIKEYSLDDEEFEERMRDMCNLGEALELEAIESERVRNIRNIIDEFHCSLEKAMDILKLTEKERQEIMPYFQA